jgi:hypothetical protein
MRAAFVSIPSPLLLFKAVPGTTFGANHTGRIYYLPDEAKFSCSRLLFWLYSVLWLDKLLPEEKSFIRINQFI